MNRERFTDIICTMVQLNSKISPHTVASSSAIDTANHPEMVELLKQSNTESKDEWVSVEGYTSEVLDHWAYHEDHKPRLCHLDVFGNGMWIDSITNQGLLPQPTHIMPINVPQPPKQGSQS